jgi:hypothetical protein
MDIIIIIILLLIILTIGQILRKPSIDSDSWGTTPDRMENYEIQYKTLLKEIRALENESGEEAGTIEHQDLLKEKKKHAAEILSIINPSL